MAICPPRNGFEITGTSSAVIEGLSRNAGIKNLFMKSRQPITYSGEYNGSDIATHSAQPAVPFSFVTLTIKTSRLVCVPNEVLNGRTNGR